MQKCIQKYAIIVLHPQDLARAADNNGSFANAVDENEARIFLIWLIHCCQKIYGYSSCDRQDWRIILYSPFMGIGYRQLIDLILVKGIFDVMLHKQHIKWTSARRKGLLQLIHGVDSLYFVT